MEKPAKIIEMPGSPWSNERLIAELRERSRHAALALYDRYGPLVNRLLWRSLGADSDHDDLVQEVFATLFEKIAAVRDPAALESWIASVTVNTARKELRRRRYRTLLASVGLGTEPVSGHAFDPEHHVAAREIFQILDRMAPDDRMAFALCTLEQMTQADAARACGVSLATLKRRLVRATRQVEAQLQAENEEAP